MRARAMGPDRVVSVTAFGRAALNYWTSVFPQVSRELRGWRDRAQGIPDPALRSYALEALCKRGNMEGAAAFATFAPCAQRSAVVRATVAFQSAYNYLDTLSEQPSRAPLENSRLLHEALLGTLQPDTPELDYYRHHEAWGGCGDGGYLAALVETCRRALSELPSYTLVAPAARRAAERVVSFQTFNTGNAHGAAEAMERWGRAQTPPGIGLRWWETAASGGSSLGVHVMIAAAAEPDIEVAHVQALEHAYFPWIGALHSMLDHLIDSAEDARTGQRNLIDLYGTPQQAAERMRLLSERALASARSLEPTHRHELIVAAMASFYMADPEARKGDAALAAAAVLDVFGPLARPALAIFDARRTVERVYYACRDYGRDDKAAHSFAIAAIRR